MTFRELKTTFENTDFTIHHQKDASFDEFLRYIVYENEVFSYFDYNFIYYNRLYN